jgi:hypothetical protein
MLSAAPIRAPWELLGKAILDPGSEFKFQRSSRREKNSGA